MLAPLLALGFACSAPAVAAPAPEAAVVVARQVGPVVAHRLPDGRILLTPGRTFEFTPETDGPGAPPRWIELALPAGSRRHHAARTETLITVPRGIVLELSNLVGDIKVEGWDKDAVRVVAEHGRLARLQTRLVELRARSEATRRRVEAQARRQSRQVVDLERVLGRLEIATLDRHGIPAAVDYTISVPHWMALKLSGMESDISVEGVRAAIEAGSIRGDVRVRGGRGLLQISSVEGEVKAFDCDGQLEASSINSGVEMDDVAGELTIETVNGDIRMGRVKSRRVEASSMNGTVIFRGPFQPNGRYRLASHAGNLVVGVPVDAAVDVSVATFQGGFRTAFPVELGPWRKGEKFNFVLGTGGSSLELESFQGLIELLRPGEMPAVAPVPMVHPTPRPSVVPKVPTPKAPKPPKQPRTPEPEDDLD